MALLVAGPLLYRKVRQSSEERRAALKKPQAVEEAGYVRIGGVDQWIQARGENTSNPVLLFVHGGPGVSYVPFGDRFRAWESRFTVVHWDQRGAGKSRLRSDAERGSLTIERLVSDGIEVAEHLRKRFGKERVVLFAHSWGTVVALRMAHARPDLFEAYIGAGQVICLDRSEAISYQMLMKRLERSGNEGDRRALVSAGPPPYREMRPWMVKQRLIVMTSPPPKAGENLPNIMTAALFTPGYSLRDSLDWFRAFGPATRSLFHEMMTADAVPDCPALRVPTVFVQGTDDLQAPIEAVEEYMAEVRGGDVSLVRLEGEGHTVVLTRPDLHLEQIDAILTHGRPTDR